MSTDGLLKCDERRRITLPKGLAEEGEEFVAFKVRGDIILKPIPKDPLKALQKEGRKLRGFSTKELRKRAHDLAVKEAMKGIKW